MSLVFILVYNCNICFLAVFQNILILFEAWDVVKRFLANTSKDIISCLAIFEN